MSAVAVSPKAFRRWPARPVHPSDQAQARVFEELLRGELRELESRPFSVRITEVRRLLHALETRFTS
jgi:hypothetical protein